MHNVSTNCSVDELSCSRATISYLCEYYRQVFFLHSGLQDENLQIVMSKFFNMHKGRLSLHMGHPVKFVPI